ncbi:MAG: class I SAM-dependent rRNA methyltransferase [Desulfobacterales bacterium]
MTEVPPLDPREWPELEITPRAAQRLAGGHLWVFANEVVSGGPRERPVFWCRFRAGGRSVGRGYFNRHSLIAGRVVAGGEGGERLEALLEQRLLRAIGRRLPLAPTRAARLVFSEADFLPGLVVDYYPPYAVLQSHTAGIDLVLPLLERLLPEALERALGVRLAGLVLRADQPVRDLEAVERFRRVVFGDPQALRAAWVEEGGVRYAADLLEGQKTGFFLDQRENRLRFAEAVRTVPGARVLDLFSYSGGWGLQALRAGAARVVFVEESREALDLLERSLEASGVPRERAILCRAEALGFLARDAGRYEFVVSDPPAFAKSRKTLPQARRAYLKLNRLAWRRLEPGGLLVACSCSRLVAENEFLAILADACRREGDAAHVAFRGMQAPDHPVLLSMPETAYLKCIGLRKVVP